MAKSRGQEVRGLKHGAYRPSLIILDDVEAADRVLNEEQRYKTKQVAWQLLVEHRSELVAR